MIRTELRTWDKYKNKSEWKEFINSLSKEDYSIYQSFNSYRSHIVRTEKKMDKLKTQIEELKERQNEYYKKLTKVNSKIDHLRKKFYVSPNVSYWDKGMDNDDNEYFNGKIGRSGYKSFGLNLGNIKTVKQRLLDYYKGNYNQLTIIRRDSKDRQKFKDLVNKYLVSPRVKTIIRNEIRKNPKMKSLKKSLNVLFPLTKLP
jgi:hypothetical protein